VAAEPFDQGDVEVTLRLPPPLEVDLTIERDGDRALLRDTDKVVAEAIGTTLTLDPEPPVTFEAAEAASHTFPWRETHPFPTCFVCGPKRAPGDGLCLYPGAVPGRRVAAAPWMPDASLDAGDGRVSRPMVWAALDCPSWFGFHCFEPSFAQPILLGRLTARIAERPRIGERHVVQGWFLGRDGRKIHTASAIYDSVGTLHGLARATWIILK
jgi:hypothetical protein